MASCAETGDLLDGLLRPGNAHTAEGALGFILGLVDRCKARMCRSVIVRIDAGFPDHFWLITSLDESGIRGSGCWRCTAGAARPRRTWAS